MLWSLLAVVLLMIRCDASRVPIATGSNLLHASPRRYVFPRPAIYIYYSMVHVTMNCMHRPLVYGRHSTHR